MDNVFLEKLFNCNDCGFVPSCEKTFYHVNNKPKIALFMQNPGTIVENEEKLIKLRDCKNASEKVDYHVDALKEWLLKNNKFFERFLLILKKDNILNLQVQVPY